MRMHVVIRYIGMMLILLASFMLASAGVSILNNYDSAYLTNFAPWSRRSWV